MQLHSLAKWVIKSIPRAPKRTGILMRLYYFWQEYVTPSGHALLALLLFSMFAGMVPGFWAAWIFCGLVFLFVLALIVSLFCTYKFSKIKIKKVFVTNTIEGQNAKIIATVVSSSNRGELYLGAFRINPSLKSEQTAPIYCIANEPVQLECLVHSTCRGAFNIPKIAVVVPEIMGMFSALFPLETTFELLVYPRAVRISSFPFLTSGGSGGEFLPLLSPLMNRGLDFVGVREYREGDSLRDLHHKAFARYGRPFTKEFEVERGAGVVLVLDTSTPDLASRMQLENAIRLTAGVGLWLLERGILGRFFVGNNEFFLDGSDSLQESFLQILARIPNAELFRYEKFKTWSPAGRPMGPVFRIGLCIDENPFVHKQIIVSSKCKKIQRDSLLIVDGDLIESILKKNAEVTL